MKNQSPDVKSELGLKNYGQQSVHQKLIVKFSPTVNRDLKIPQRGRQRQRQNLFQLKMWSELDLLVQKSLNDLTLD